jgi:hypothetical protein
MRKFLFASVLSLAAFLFLVPAQLRADGLNFTFSEDNNSDGGLVTLTWQLPENPVPDVSDSGVGFVITSVAISASLSGSPLFSLPGDLFFFNASNVGLQFFNDWGFSLSGAAQPQMYWGDESSPNFIPGVYSGFDLMNFDANGAPEAATLIIATPEPPSILMYLVGFLALAGVFVVRRVQG